MGCLRPFQTTREVASPEYWRTRFVFEDSIQHPPRCFCGLDGTAYLRASSCNKVIPELNGGRNQVNRL